METAAAYRTVDGPGRVYRYKLGTKAGLMGGAVVLVALALTKPLLTSQTEWHLFTAGDPFVIPSFLLQLLWLVVFGAGVTVLISVYLPPMHVAVTDQSVRAPSLLTRKYTELAWADVVEVLAHKNAVTLNGLNGRVHIGRLAMSDEDWNDILLRINESVGSAARRVG